METEKYHEILENSNSSKVNEIDDSTTKAQVDDEDNTGMGRTYECSYCKRGFTNAQALGGHMNIHRKEKAKSKHHYQQQNYYSSSPTISYNHNNDGLSSYTNPSLAPQMGIYGANYNFNYQSYNYPFANTMYSQPSIYGTNDFSSGKTRLFGMYEDHHMGADLSLRTNNSSSMVNHFHQGEENKNNEDKYGAIDLELRLGYDP